MQFFLENAKRKMQRELVWNLVEFGWGLPLKLDGTRDKLENSIPKKKHNKLDNKGSEANAWVLYIIFNKVSPNEFFKILTCKSAEEALDILSIPIKVFRLWPPNLRV